MATCQPVQSNAQNAARRYVRSSSAVGKGETGGAAATGISPNADSAIHSKRAIPNPKSGESKLVESKPIPG